jgi:hypothetical protein
VRAVNKPPPPPIDRRIYDPGAAFGNRLSRFASSRICVRLAPDGLPSGAREDGMSYEGYKEQLCTNGHYSAQDVYADQPEACPHCGAPFEFVHGVDQTNGYDEELDYTFDAAKIEKGFSDIWHTDHYGTRYAIKLIEYAPAPKSPWRLNTRPTEPEPWEQGK